MTNKPQTPDLTIAQFTHDISFKQSELSAISSPKPYANRTASAKILVKTLDRLVKSGNPCVRRQATWGMST
jgi:hypothetical protein